MASPSGASAVAASPGAGSGAAPSTPGSGSALAGLPATPLGLHKYALGLPLPKKTNDSNLDETNLANYRRTQDLVSGLLNELQHVPAVHNKMRERQRSKMAGALEAADKSHLFTRASTAKHLDEDWKIDYVVKNSGGLLVACDLTEAKKVNDETVTEMYVYATQLPPQMKLKAECGVKGVMTHLSDARVLEVGPNRVADFVRNGGFNRTTHRVNWKHGCFTPFFDENGIMVKLKHGPTGDEVCTPGCTVSNKYKLKDNFLDFGASFVLGQFPPIKCALFFSDAKSGPHRFAALTGGSKIYETLLAAAVKKHQEVQDAANAVAASEVAHAYDEYKKATNKEKASHARGKAAEALRAKRARRELDLSVEDAEEGAAAEIPGTPSAVGEPRESEHPPAADGAEPPDELEGANAANPFGDLNVAENSDSD